MDDLTEPPDELDAYLEEAMQDPAFRAAYRVAEAKAARKAGKRKPLAAMHSEYHRRTRHRRG